MLFDSLGDRMKNYENVERRYLTRRTPVILRLDGKSFSKYTSKFDKPYDFNIIIAMQEGAKYLMQEIQGAKFAYLQSDECSIIISDYDTIKTDAWFGYNLQKIVSIAAAEFSVQFNFEINWMLHKKVLKFDSIERAIFDARAFNIPPGEILNYLIWRQQDWTRNSVQGLARKYYSQNELMNKNVSDMHEMIHQAGDNWAGQHPVCKNGTFLYYKANEEGREIIQDFPIFTREETKTLVQSLINNFEGE